MGSVAVGHGSVRVVHVEGKGRGLVAARDIARGEVILTEPVIVVRSPDEIRLIDEKTVLGLYAVEWGQGSVCFPLGLTMLINHTRKQDRRNVTAEHDYDNDVICVRAVRDIATNEELLFDYEVADDQLSGYYGIPLDA